ncbi:uncharacterized protein LOC136074076 [Hydra vulgaris]|uniref:Uncharacterized protein LOC136074076 n=1 Tax=Hydra vulgaris TaxID=6087 RepID=A0ABM4B0Y8_HYDVU
MARKKLCSSKRRLQYTDSQLRDAINAVKKGMVMYKASKTFGIPYQTLRDKISRRTSLKIQHCGYKSVLGEQIENKLVEWLFTCTRMGFAMSVVQLLDTVQKYLNSNNIKTKFTNNRPAKGWFYAFLRRHIQLSQKRGEYLNRARGGGTEKAIRNCFTEIPKLLEENAQYLNDSMRVFNIDESGFQLSPKTNLLIRERGKILMRKCSKIINAAPSGWSIGKSENDWMNAECFFEYITNVFYPSLIKEEILLPVIIFFDGHVSHFSIEFSEFCSKNGIIFVALFLNATHILQPLDVAVYGPMKAKWKLFCRQWRIDYEGQEINNENVPEALNSFIIDPIMANNIKSGFKNTGIFPFDANSVDYKKIVQKLSESTVAPAPYLEENHSSVTLSAYSPITFIEKCIDFSILEQFKLADKHLGWKGDLEYLQLYHFWKRALS